MKSCIVGDLVMDWHHIQREALILLALGAHFTFLLIFNYYYDLFLIII